MKKDRHPRFDSNGLPIHPNDWLYEDCILCQQLHPNQIDFRAIHDAIRARWSDSAVERIKKMAWKRLD